ncbi:VOC family protein [Actinomadura rupiterrae]|uniref:VOC family protein n=1 Tax=Actinomadura rupiterrae TaxID=559627 RepID=UPI0020A3F8E6|nr:VOC family protein [Actinomadura rupiterrae]MCP2341709.1 methylmalonyl-CoA/ethylmalonyl-CoA epimerase [Actinomadura rupiterrae]
MILGIDHIGLATDDPDGVAPFLTALGLAATDRGEAGAYGVACEFWHRPEAPGQAAIELVSPVQEDSSIAARLADQGPGIYHVAFTVDDLEADLAKLRAQGFTAVDREPCAGARPGMRVAFLYARRPAGLLVELVQYEDHPRIG